MSSSRPSRSHTLISCSTVIIKAYSDCKLPVVQFSLLNGSIHDSWLQQGHEGMPMNDEIRGKCEVLACSKQFTAEPHRKKPDRASEVHNSLKTVPLRVCSLLLCLKFLVYFTLWCNPIQNVGIVIIMLPPPVQKCCHTDRKYNANIQLGNTTGR